MDSNTLILSNGSLFISIMTQVQCLHGIMGCKRVRDDGTKPKLDDDDDDDIIIPLIVIKRSAADFPSARGGCPYAAVFVCPLAASVYYNMIM